MKRTKKLLVAVCLLLVSATLLGTASFAWFSMNTEVSVDGIEVEAYSDALFLEIANENDDSKFDVATSLTAGKQRLRLVTNGFVEDADVVKLLVTDASGNYDGTGTYYIKADSDVTDSNDDYDNCSNDGKNNFVLATDLEAPSSTADLYKIVFKKNASGTKYDSSGTATYYVKDITANAYRQVDVATLADDQDISAFYTIDNVPSKESSTAVYDGTSTYFTLAQVGSLNVYTIVGNLELGSSLVGYYTLTDKAHDADTSADDGVADYYYIKNEVDTDKYEYSCLGYAITAELDEYAPIYWGRAYADDIGEVQNNAGFNNTLNIIPVDLENKSYDDNYFYYDTVYLRSAENTNPGKNLKIAEVNVGGRVNELSAALRVLFVATNGKGEVVYTTYDNGNASAFNGALFDTILGDKGEVVTVEMYVYFDGTDEVSLTKADVDAGMLNGQTIDVKFTIDGPDYNN